MSEEEKDLKPKYERVIDVPQTESQAPSQAPVAQTAPAPLARAEETDQEPTESTREEFPRADEVVPPVVLVPQPQEEDAAEDDQDDDENDDDQDEDADEEGEEASESDAPQTSQAGETPPAPSVSDEPSRPQQPQQQGQQQQGQPGERHGRRRRRRGRGGRGRDGQQQGGQQQGGQQQGGQQQSQQQRQGGRDQQQRDRNRDRNQDRNQGRGRDGREGREERRREDHHDNQRVERRADRRGEGREHVHRGAEQRGPKKAVKREVLANTSFEETRIAIVEDGRLAELHWERTSTQKIVGNIYKGTVENVLPGISSAFVNIGYDKNAYLYISDVLGERGAAIDQTLKKGQTIMVQVAKEAISTKGMKVTMDVSLPGRFLVFTPFQSYVGISKHIADPEERRRLSGIVDKLVAEQLGGRGLVVRTEAEGATAEELEREVRYLQQTWAHIQKTFEEGPSPNLLHKDLDLALQIARDILSDQVYVYMLDNKDVYKAVCDFIEGFAPELKERVRLYDGKTPIFKAFHLEKDIESLRKTKVPLPNGGSIVIQEAESLCAIDVNTGRFTGNKSQEETVTQTNIEAAQEVAHQLRLRNIGGIVVVDFIDMRKASNRNKVMEAFAQAVKADRAKIRILPITRLGLIEMTRERKRESTVSLITEECQECKGAGRVLSSETIRIRVQREIMEMTGGRAGGSVRVQLHPALAERFRQQQQVIEKNIGRSIKVQADPQVQWEDYRIVIE
jgi:ribonuclease G